MQFQFIGKKSGLANKVLLNLQLEGQKPQVEGLGKVLMQVMLRVTFFNFNKRRSTTVTLERK